MFMHDVIILKNLPEKTIFLFGEKPDFTLILLYDLLFVERTRDILNLKSIYLENTVVTSSKAFQAFHADFFPFFPNIDTVSQPVRANQKGSARQTLSFKVVAY